MKIGLVLAGLIGSTLIGCASPSTGDRSGAAGTGASGVGAAGSVGTTGAAGTAAAGATGASGTTGAAGTTGADAGAPDGGDAGPIDLPPTGPCAPPTDIYAPIDRLSLTGCMDPKVLTRFVSRAVPYEVQSPLWSDLADKTRAFVLPTGGKIHVKSCATTPADCPNGAADDGKWVFPVGTVLIKNFLFDGMFVETRLFMHIADTSPEWVGYGYQWNEAQTEATIAPIDRSMKMFNTGKRTVTWNYPSRMDCMKCHDPNGGSTLGPETAQMNRAVGGGGNPPNQIDVMAGRGVFETAPAKPYKTALVTPYAGQAGTPPVGATVDEKARSYMHANCAFCHRPAGAFPNFDLRFDTAFADRKICNAPTKKTGLGITATTVFVPGSSATSAMWQRVHEPLPDRGRMPQIGSYVVDEPGAKLIADWIDSIKTCP